MSRRDCNLYSETINQICRWRFGSVMTTYFSGIPFVLEGAGNNGEDLTFTASPKWLSENRPQYPDKKEIGKYLTHVTECKSPQCMQAYENLRRLNFYLKKGNIPGGNTTISQLVCFPEIATEVRIVKDKTQIIEKLKPLFELLNE